MLQLLTLAVAAAVSTAEPPAGGRSRSAAWLHVRQTVHQLKDSRYETRQEAMKELIRIGLPSVAPLELAARARDKELSYRASLVLLKLNQSTDIPTARSAHAALRSLMESGSRRTVNGVAHLMRFAEAGAYLRMKQLSARIEPGGATITISNGWTGSDDDLSVLRSLTNLKVLRVRGIRLGEAGIQHIASHPSLEELGLFDVPLDNRAARHLGSASQLKILYLTRTGLTDEDARFLRGLSSLRWLDLIGCQITDKGLRHFSKLPQLRALDLRLTGVTSAGAGNLQRQLPMTKILFGSE